MVLAKKLLRSLLGFRQLLGYILPSRANTSFKKSNGEIDVAAMVDALEKHLKQHFWKTA
jgi:hypothetical protein